MTRPALLAIDLGTSAAKALLVDAESGAPLALARRDAGTEVSTEAGASEQDPNAWWSAIAGATREVLRVAQERAGRIEVRGIAPCGHGPTVVPVRGDGTPVGSAITWRDTQIGRAHV